jgi:ketosteroid isomerase-like protein
MWRTIIPGNSDVNVSRALLECGSVRKGEKNLMKRNVLSAALVLVGLVTILAQAACQRAAAPTNLADRGAAAAPTPEKVDPAAIQAELLNIDRQWAEGVKTGDADSVRRVIADDIVITNADGSTSSKADEVQTIQSGAITMEAYEILDPKVTVLDANNAFITGRGVIKNGRLKLPNSTRPIDISGEYRFTNVYAKRDGTWQAVASQTTPIQKNP